MRRGLAIPTAFFCIAYLPGLITAQSGARTVSRPTFFEPDDRNRGLENAQPPSDIVLDALLKEAKANELDREIEGLTREQKRVLFETVRVNLGPTAEEDFVVHGKPPLIGADCEWFWIVRVRRGEAGVLLFANGLALELRKRVVNGYREINASWATAGYVGDRLYKFDGTIYRLVREHTEGQKP